MANSISTRFKWNNAKLSSLERNTKQGLRMVAEEMSNKAKENAPYDTGNLSRSIRVRETGVPGEIEVVAGGSFAGVEIKYAVRREYENNLHPGTKHYMRRAMNSVLQSNWKQKYFGGITK